MIDGLFFSVIAPEYQVVNTIACASKSVLPVNVDSYEAIVVDDGSTGPTFGIFKIFVPLDRRANLIEQSNGGKSLAHDVAFRAAIGNRLMFVDSIDLLLCDSSSAVRQGLNSAPATVLFPYVQKLTQVNSFFDSVNNRAASSVNALSLGDVRGACLQFDSGCVHCSDELRFSKTYGSNAVMLFPFIAIYFLAGLTFGNISFNPYAVFLSDICISLLWLFGFY